MIAARKNFVILLLLIGIFAPDIGVSALPGAQYSKYKVASEPQEKPTSLSDILLHKDVGEKIVNDLDVKSHLNMAATSKDLIDVPYRGLSREERKKGRKECKQHWKSIYSVLTSKEAVESAFNVHLRGKQGNGIRSAQFFKCFDFLNSVWDKRKHLRGRPIRIDLTIPDNAKLARASKLSSESASCLYTLKIRASSTKIVQFIQLAGWKLSELDLSYNDMGADGTAAVVRSLAKQADLKVFSLSYNNIGQDGASKLAAAFNSNEFAPKFSELDLSWNNMGDDGTAVVVRSLANQPDLKVLKLGDNNIGQDRTKELADIFNSDNFKPKLSELDLSGNYIGDDGTAAVVRSLAKQADLKVLSLRYNNIGQDGARKLAAIFNSDEFAPKLSELDLNWNYMGADGTDAVVRSLAKQADLNVLKLGDNNIGQDRTKELADIFNSDNFKPKLSELDLSYNDMGADGTAAVVGSLAKQADLKVLSLSYNNIGQDGASKLAAIFNSNEFAPKLSELDLYGNDIRSFSLLDTSIRANY